MTTYEQALGAVAKRSFATLATTSADGAPHVAGVLYAAVGDVLWVSTSERSKKARNIAGDPRVFLCVPVRRLPVGPPSSVQVAGTAEIRPLDDPELRRLAAGKAVRSVTGHGELDLEGGCFLRIHLRPVLHTYGIGMPLLHLLRDPLNAAATVRRPVPA